MAVNAASDADLKARAGNGIGGTTQLCPGNAHASDGAIARGSSGGRGETKERELNGTANCACCQAAAAIVAPGYGAVRGPPIPLPVLALRSASLAALTATTLPPWKHASTWIKFAVELLARHTAKAYKDICQEVVGIHLKRRQRARSS